MKEEGIQAKGTFQENIENYYYRKMGEGKSNECEQTRTQKQKMEQESPQNEFILDSGRDIPVVRSGVWKHSLFFFLFPSTNKKVSL